MRWVGCTIGSAYAWLKEAWVVSLVMLGWCETDSDVDWVRVC